MSSETTRSWGWVDWFVPEPIRDQPDLVRRARLFVLGCFTLALLAVVGQVVRAMAGPLDNPRLGFVIIVAAPFIMRYTRRMGPAAALVLLVLVVQIGLVSWRNGGISAPMALAIPAVPLAATFFAGPRVGLAFAAVMVAEAIALYALRDQQPPAPLGNDDIELVRTAVTILVVAMVSVFAWLYERQRLLKEQLLSASEERLRLALEGAHDGLFDWDIEAGRTHYSARFRELLGLSLDHDLPAEPFASELVAPADRSRLESALERHLLEGEPFSAEARLMVTGPGGGREARWFEIRGSAVRSPEGEAERMVGSVRDIEARKEMERVKGQFIANVSHELRTPLTSIQGSLGLLQGGAAGALPEAQMNLVEIAHRNVRRLRSLVDDLLDLRRLEAGKFTLRRTEVSVPELLEEALRMHAGIATHEGVSFQLSGAVEARVEGDPERLLQVLGNLLSNAAKHGPAGSAVELAVGCHGERLEFTVTDRGPGVPESERERIFERFEQVDSSSSREHAGSGLGLSIARAIIDAHGGEIGYRPAEGGGSAFYFRLPAVPGSIGDPVGGLQAGSARLAGGRPGAVALGVDLDGVGEGVGAAAPGDRLEGA